MTVLAITGFEILVEDSGTYAYISADVDVLVDTYYGEPITVPTACEAKVLLADDTDLNALQHAAEQWELAEDVSLWDYVDPSDDEITASNSIGTPWHDGCWTPFAPGSYYS
jgi:hypothetical protein